MKTKWSEMKIATLFVVMLAMTTGLALADHPWLTGRTFGDQTEPMSWFKNLPPEETQAQFDQQLAISIGGGPIANGPVGISGGSIDLVITLTDTKDGDDNGNAQGGAGNAEQDRVERIVQHFADAVYEMSEGAHRLRNVRIFQDNEQEANCDILWGPSGIPKANVSGNRWSGGKIWMYDEDPRNSGPYTERKAGYTLAHELGHYLYGLYDEYKLEASDDPVERSIMHSQFQAANLDDFGWLNFSITYQADNPNGDWVNTKKTKQHRERGASGWETLARPASEDPGVGEWLKRILGRGRTFFPEIAAVAPTGTNSPVINMPNAAARGILNIMWTDADFVTVLVLDRSGSMNSQDMANMKLAANHLLDVVPIGAHVGIVSFAGDVMTNAPIRRIVDDTDRLMLKSVVNALSEGGNTALGQASVTALNQIEAYGAAGAVSAVFLMTDGYGNSGTHQDLLGVVVPLFQNAQVPIMGFGYGGSVDSRLPQMAASTGGKYYSSPTDFTSVAEAFQDAYGYVSGAPSLATGKVSSPARGVNIPIMVDTSIASFTITLTYDGLADAADILLYAPRSRTGIGPKSVTMSGGQSLWLFEVPSPVAGQWNMRGPAEQGLEIRYVVNATQEGSTYHLRTEIIGGSSVTAPSPMTIIAQLSHQLPINGARVTATVTDPEGKIATLRMKNTTAGQYEATYLAYSRNGAYSVDVQAENVGRARMTYEGLAISIPDDGKFDNRVPRDIVVREKFSRSSSLQATVTGVSHAPQGATDEWAPTFIWPADPDAIRYVVEIDNAGGRRILRGRARRGENHFIPRRPLPVGAYTWRVATTKRVEVPVLDRYGNQRVDRHGNPLNRMRRITEWSADYTFIRTANLPGAILKVGPDTEEFAGDVYLWWQPDAAATSYQIVLQRSRDGVTFNRGRRIRLVPKEEGTDRFLVRRMRPGVYRWFIQGIGPDGAGPEDANGMVFEVVK